MSIGQVPGIEPVTSCSAVKRSIDWTGPAAWTKWGNPDFGVLDFTLPIKYKK